MSLLPVPCSLLPDYVPLWRPELLSGPHRHPPAAGLRVYPNPTRLTQPQGLRECVATSR